MSASQSQQIITELAVFRPHRLPAVHIWGLLLQIYVLFVCLSVCLSVCMCVGHTGELCKNG